MATEHAEEVKLTGDIKETEEESCPRSKDFEVKGEETIKAEDSHGGREEGGAEESATELEAATVSEEKVEDVKNEPILEEVRREEDVTGDAIQKEENSKVDPESSLAGSKEDTDSSEKEAKNRVDVTDVPEQPKESTEALLDDSKATMVQESESETNKEFVVPQAAVEEVITTEELPEIPSEPVTKGKKEPESVVSPSVEPVIEEENTEPPKEETPVTDTVRIEEVSEDVPEAVVSETKEFKDDAGVTAVTEEDHNEPETAECDQNAVINADESVSIDSDSTVENVSVPVKPEDKFEREMQEKAVVSEERTMSITTNNDDATQVTEISVGSGGTENVEEVREATLEGFVLQEKAVLAEDLTMGDTADVDASTQVSEVSSGGVEKIENKEASLEGPIIQENAVVAEEPDAIVAEEPTMNDATESERATKVTEVSFKCFDGAEKVEEKEMTTLEGLFMQEKAVVAEELTMSDTTESEAAIQVPEVSSDKKKEAILEGLLMQEKAAVAEEPTLPDTIKTDGATQVTDISSEGSGVVENVEMNEEANLECSVIESSRDLDDAAEVPQVSPEGEKASESVEEKDATLESANVTLVETSRDIDADKIVNENTGKDETEASVEPMKEGDEAPKAEVTAKSSHRQSSNLFSKVKHSIVKVKKAILGKSPSSKAAPVEVKDEIKVK